MNLGKIMPPLLVTAMCIMACTGPATKKHQQQNKPRDSITVHATDTMIVATDNVSPGELTSWSQLLPYNGKYADETLMLQSEPLATRLKQLLGNAEKAFLERYQVIPPVEITDGLLYNEGCKPHFCMADEAVIAIDMERDIIYAGIAVDSVVTLYSEHQDTSYPNRLLQWKQKFALP
jgi:hypothetical protein